MPSQVFAGMLSRNDSDRGLVEILITVVRNGTGRIILLTDGIHGNEYTGQNALSQLAQNLDPTQV